MAHLLEVSNLHVEFATPEGRVPAVRGVSFKVDRGETLAIVGESGSGKSVTSMAVLGLIARPGRIAEGRISLEGRNLRTLSGRELRRRRGKEMSVIFQEPMTSLNPVFTIGYQIAEVIRAHEKASRAETRRRVLDMLERVGIANAGKVASSFPHQLSGGMRQRVMIAMALACKPKLLIADEPTTALDVTIQAQILALIKRLSKEENMGVVLITHDLGVVAEMADRVAVMYAGQIVETTDVRTLFRNPRHPYTQGLLRSLPKIHEDGDRLVPIPGTVPNPLEWPKGCAFASRCAWAAEQCLSGAPELEPAAEHHHVRCLRNREVLE